ncbi:glycosyltransferase [Catenuloplanes atrovinosus]|uniref:UDP:flavonoid glycosyltransferase YjiC (YdhE family) n=1 Tax=Catenuloplanes atrovinosus TaxID=137266 RepID=A0AAE3YWM3_9ACTN|nr:glycosyltransferase [Catenuloplanes atrovinosus]MDR7280127.1 UDP:flavonoid glycosyltransferase YjiC (YdhE family) [Catenuloplanes atrovinosus]
MKALFTTFPAYGHLLPMLPLAEAAAADGASVVIATHESLHGTAPHLTTRAFGPALPALLAENETRSGEDVLGYRSDSDRMLDSTVALFTTTYADLAFDELLRIAETERPDVIIGEQWDYLGPLAAQRLGIPWAVFHHSPATDIDAILTAGAAKAGAQRGLPLPSPIARIQLWPEWLETTPPSDPGLPITSTAYNTPVQADIPAFTGDRPVVLITLGTVVDDLPLLRTAVHAVLDAGADALVTTGLTATPADLGITDPTRVRAVSFAPIAQLLDHAHAVLAAGGSGTTLATLSRGLPLLFIPAIANQPLVASLVTTFGAGLVAAAPDDLATAIPTLLADPDLRTQAQTAQFRLASRLSPAVTWSTLLTKLP